MSPRSRKASAPPHVNVPLSAKVLRDGRIIIEIGANVLAFATTRSAYAWSLANPHGVGMAHPADRYEVTNADGFARDAVAAMLAEKEGGTSMLSDMLNRAAQKAIEDGSEHFREKGDAND